MSLIQFVIGLIVIGVIMWLVNAYIPMQSTIKRIVNIVVVVAVLLYVLMAFGIIGSLNGIHMRGF